MAGDTTTASIIWVPGESTGKDIYGASHALPVDTDTSQIAAAVASAVAAGITVSGGVPSGAPTGSKLQFNSDTRILYAYNGSAWVTVSGGL